MIVGVNHAQVNVPSVELERARAFYIGFLGLKEIQRPAVFKSAGIWMNAGSFELHIGVEDNVERVTRAHIAYEVDNIDAWRAKVRSAGYAMKEQPAIPGYDRFQFRDPFGNNLGTSAGCS
jgi:catechol 2,3-dioxygenase-like lactoylglutathione lyase family enzyme